MDVPGLGQAALDHDLAKARGNIAPRDDRITPASGADDLDRGVPITMSVRSDPDTGELGSRRERGDVRECMNPSGDALQRLRIEANDEVREVSGPR